MKARSKPPSKEGFADGLEDIFRGLGDLLQTAAQFSEKAEPGELSRSGSLGPSGLRAVYGASVRVGPGGKRSMQRFGNLRQRPGEPRIFFKKHLPISNPTIVITDFALNLAAHGPLTTSPEHWPNSKIRTSRSSTLCSAQTSGGLNCINLSAVSKGRHRKMG